MSLRLKLTLWNLAILALALGAFGYGLIASSQSQLLTSIDRDLRARAHIPRFGGPPGPAMVGPDGMMMPPPRRGPGPGGPRGPRRPVVLDARGQVLDPDGPQPVDREAVRWALAGRRTLRSLTADGERFRVLTIPWQDEGDAHVIQVSSPLREYDVLVASQSRTLAVMLPLALVAAGLGALFLTNRALRPVADVTRAAAEIGAQDLSRRLPVNGRDELAQLARTFNEMIARLQESFHDLQVSVERQRRFTADASHELRTPLTRIRLATGNGLEEPFEPEIARKSLKIADDAAVAMGKLVEELLILSRADSGELPMRREPLDLRVVASEAVDQLPGEATIQTDLPDRPVAIVGDAGHLRRAILNLLQNAVRHSPKDKPIRVVVDAGGTVTVQDEGEGIAPEHQERVWDRFYRVDSARTRADGGVGLGLSIVRSIAEAHGGAVLLESQKGHGTKIGIKIPTQTIPS